MAHIHTPIPRLNLNDSHSVPMLAFGTGTAWFKRAPGELDPELVKSIKTAINLEYTHLDGAQVYNTEAELGQAITESKADRSKLFVTTKIFHDGKKDIKAELEVSLKKLQLEYVDLYLIHAPFWAADANDGGKFDAAPLQAAWADMEAVQASGLARSIGVSNYGVAHLQATLDTAKVPPAVNQIEFHPYLQSTELLAFHKEHRIATEAYGPLAPVTKATGGPIDGYLAALAKKYAVNPSEILLRWCIDQDIVPITTSGKEQRLSDYLRAATFKLTPKEIEELGELGKGKHFRAFFQEKFPHEVKA